MCLWSLSSITDAKSNITEGKVSFLRPGPASDLEAEVVIQADDARCQKAPRFTLPAETIMVYDLTHRKVS